MAEPTTLSVNLPRDLSEKAELRARSLQFRDFGFYLRWLIAKDALPESEDAHLEVSLIKEGLESGGADIADDAFFHELAKETDLILERKAAAKAARAAG